MVTQEEHDWARNEERYKAEMDDRFRKRMEETAFQRGFDEGFARGWAEGYAQGLAEALADTTIPMFQRVLKRSQTPTQELLRLPVEELQQLAQNLEQELTKLHQPGGAP